MKLVQEDLERQEKTPVRDYPVSLAGMINKVAKLGHPVPSKPKSLSRFDWPLDITKVGNEDVRGLISYYTAQLAYVNYSIAKLSFLIGKVELEEKKTTRILRAKLYKKGMKRDEISGRIERDKELESLANTRLHGQGVLETLKLLKENYVAYISASSRELTARSGELGNYKRKGGEGK